ncbi:hypothetical protein [Stenotrophomonas rhizophila]
MTILMIRHLPPGAAPDAMPLPARVAGHRVACRDCDSLSALEALPAPYIEMASNDDDALDEHLHPQHAPTARVVCSSGRDDACRLSLAIAARRLTAEA